MANIASAKKRMRQNLKRRARNRAIKSATRTQVRKFLAALGSGDLQAAQDQFRLAARALDKAAGRGVLHKNTVARQKSRLAAKLNEALATAQG